MLSTYTLFSSNYEHFLQAQRVAMLIKKENLKLKYCFISKILHLLQFKV